MPIEPRDKPPAPPTTDQPFKPQLVAANDLEDAIATMLLMFNPYATESLLKEYVDVCSDQPKALVYQACKDWIKAPPENRAARAHELRAKARELQEQATAKPKPWQIEDAPVHRPDLDRIFTELARENPSNDTLQWMIRERARAQAGGHPLGEQETLDLLGSGVAAAHPRPQARAPEEETP